MAEVDTNQILVAISELRLQVSNIKREEKVDLEPIIERLQESFTTLQDSINIVVANQNTIMASIAGITIPTSIEVEEFQEI